MAGLIVTKKQLVMLIKKHGGKASVSDSNATLMRKANALGLGAKKAKPQYIGQPERPRKRRAKRRNPGPDPYRKDMLILDPAGISYTGPFGPFGQYDPQRMRNPGLPSPGQIVGGRRGNPLASAHGRDQCGYSGCRQRVVQNEAFCPKHQAEYEAWDRQNMQTNPGMGDYLLEREIAPYEVRGGLNDYMLLDMTPPAPRKKNPENWVEGASCKRCGGDLVALSADRCWCGDCGLTQATPKSKKRRSR